MITIAVNPKEYFQKFKNKSIYKKHKDMRKDAPDISFKSFAGTIIPIEEYDDTSVKLPKKVIQKRFQVKNTEMQMVSVNYFQLAGLNNKR